MALLKTSPFKGCEPRLFEWKAELLIEQKEFDSASYYLQAAAAWYKKNSCPENSYLNNYRLMALLNLRLGDYSKSAEYCYQLLPLAEADKNIYETANTLLILSNNFNRMKQSEKGIQYARQAAVITEKLTNPAEKATLYVELGSRYLWRYQDTKEKSYIDTSEYYIKKELAIAKAYQLIDLIAKGYNRLNGLAHERKNYPQAIQYNDSSILLFQQTGNRVMLGTSYGDKADTYMEMKEYLSARRYADSCLSIHKENKIPQNIANAYALIYEISNRSENYKDAVWAMNEYLVINDSLTAAEKSKKINELEKKYNQAKNESTIKDLDKKKQFYLFLSIGGLLGITTIGFFLRQQSLKHKKNILETEQRLNRARMNPHFFFNALSALQKFALKENNGQAMASNLSRFSHIMRETLESTYKEYVTIEQEIDFLNEYLEVQKIRFPETFSYTVTAAPDVETDELQIPAMIIQPFVENSIEHGFVGVDYAGKVSIHFAKYHNGLLVTITDNGKGLVNGPGEKGAGSNNNNEHISRASQIIKDRIYLLNIKLKSKAGFSIDNNPEGPGVLVQINLPLIFKDEKTNDRI